MNKLIAGIFVVVLLLLLATSVALADQPPGVAPAFRMESTTYCSLDAGYFYYTGDIFKQFSNGATGHSTYKCKLELISGEPQYFSYGGPLYSNCRYEVSLEGKKGMVTVQCFGDWYP